MGERIDQPQAGQFISSITLPGIQPQIHWAQWGLVGRPGLIQVPGENCCVTLSPSPDISGLRFLSLSRVKIGVAQYFSSFSAEKVKMNFLKVLCFPVSMLMFCVPRHDFMSLF